MKKYIKNAVKDLQNSNKDKIETTLQNKNDYKKNIIRLLYNKFINKIQRKIVPGHIKNFLLRTMGMKIGHDVCIPHDINFDVYFPELIFLGKGCLIGGECNLYTHEIKEGKITLGKIDIAERVLVGGGCGLMPGSKINKNSILMFFSDLSEEVPEEELWSGKPAKQFMKFTAEDIDKYFKPSNKDKNYYKDFKKKVKEFLKDPEQRFFKIHYNGKRLNAGMDWWRARNVFRIFYNGIIIEICRLMPHNFVKTMLFRMMGIKIGKNCHIGKGVVFDHIYGDNITLEDNVKIDDYAYLDGHEYTISQTIFGKILLKKGVHLKHHSYVRSGTTIGENSVIEPHSMAQKEIPPNEVWSGFPSKFVKKVE